VKHVLNRDGYRTRAEEDVVDRTAPSILISGESVAFGYGLEFDDSPGALLAAKTGIQTVNLAVIADAQDQQLLRLREQLPRFEKPVAVVMFVVYTWLERNVTDFRARLTLDEDGRFVETGLFPLRDSPLYQLFRSIVPYHSDEAIEIARAAMREMAAMVRRRNAYPLFVLTQCGGRCVTKPGERPRLVRHLVEGLDAPYIDFDIDKALTLPHDMHPNEKGAALYAEAIQRALREGHVTP
jgi:hypothetical protein